jgi:dipeptidyl aminopeptidase/acylaminoacyl peptidase
MARDIWQYDASNQFFASRGYAVLQVNYRGSSGYGASYQAAGLRARLDTVVLDDIADGVRHLIAQGEVDPKRIGITGASFGGWATYLSLIKYPELYRAGVAVAAVSSWRTSLSNDRWDDDRKLSYTFWKSLLSRSNFSEDEKFIDPLTRAAELHQPILIIHGEFDNVVQPREAKLMLEALRKHNPNVTAISLPFSSHTWWPFGDKVSRLNESGLFFDRWLAPEAPGAQRP